LNVIFLTFTGVREQVIAVLHFPETLGLRGGAGGSWEAATAWTLLESTASDRADRKTSGEAMLSKGRWWRDFMLKSYKKKHERAQCHRAVHYLMAPVSLF